jgi:hypothetical protein
MEANICYARYLSSLASTNTTLMSFITFEAVMAYRVGKELRAF